VAYCCLLAVGKEEFWTDHPELAEEDILLETLLHHHQPLQKRHHSHISVVLDIQVNTLMDEVDNSVVHVHGGRRSHEEDHGMDVLLESRKEDTETHILVAEDDILAAVGRRRHPAMCLMRQELAWELLLSVTSQSRRADNWSSDEILLLCLN
jgi:hypothetical protein